MRLTPNDEIDDWIDRPLEADPLPADIDDDDDEPVGPPPTESELNAAQQLLVHWQSPDDFSNTTLAMCKRCRSADYFNRPRLKFLHDAYVLAKFARLQEADSVRLESDQWPDGFIKLQGETYNIEVTSTHGGRKLGQEYRHVRGPTLDPVEDWIERADSIPKYLDEAARLLVVHSTETLSRLHHHKESLSWPNLSFKTITPERPSSPSKKLLMFGCAAGAGSSSMRSRRPT